MNSPKVIQDAEELISKISNILNDYMKSSELDNPLDYNYKIIFLAIGNIFLQLIKKDQNPKFVLDEIYKDMLKSIEEVNDA